MKIKVPREDRRKLYSSTLPFSMPREEKKIYSKFTTTALQGDHARKDVEKRRISFQEFLSRSFFFLFLRMMYQN